MEEIIDIDVDSIGREQKEPTTHVHPSSPR